MFWIQRVYTFDSEYLSRIACFCSSLLTEHVSVRFEAWANEVSSPVSPDKRFTIATLLSEQYEKLVQT
jgi:hypothetical protein